MHNAAVRIKLGTKNSYALVDYEDFIRFPKFSYSLTQHGYVRANIYLGKVGGRYKYMYKYLHQLIMGKPKKGYVIDHVNRNKLDNRRSNLRICKQSGNAQNKTSTSGYKGVHFSKHNSKNSTGKVWVAQITSNYKTTHLGTFRTPEEAAKVYNQAAIELHGEYAVLNTLD